MVSMYLANMNFTLENLICNYGIHSITVGLQQQTLLRREGSSVFLWRGFPPLVVYESFSQLYLWVG